MDGMGDVFGQSRRCPPGPVTDFPTTTSQDAESSFSWCWCRLDESSQDHWRTLDLPTPLKGSQQNSSPKKRSPASASRIAGLHDPCLHIFQINAFEFSGFPEHIRLRYDLRSTTVKCMDPMIHMYIDTIIEDTLPSHDLWTDVGFPGYMCAVCFCFGHNKAWNIYTIVVVITGPVSVTSVMLGTCCLVVAITSHCMKSSLSSRRMIPSWITIHTYANSLNFTKHLNQPWSKGQQHHVWFQ